MAYKNNYLKISSIFTNKKTTRPNWLRFVQLSIVNIKP